MAHRWLPNINEFFFSLGRLIDTCDGQLQSVSRDRSEFLTRRLDEYSRTLSIIIARFNESYGHLESQRSCLHNLSYLLERVLLLRSHFERECILQNEIDENGVLSVISVENSGVRGRPRFCLSQEQPKALHRDCGMRWSDTSRTLSVSERTVRGRRHQFGMSVQGREFSNMSDHQLDDFVSQILQATPAVGRFENDYGITQTSWLHSPKTSRTTFYMQSRSRYVHPKKFEKNYPKVIQRCLSKCVVVS